MKHRVHVFGDSHWRVFFPTLNTGGPGVEHTQEGITTVDTTANGLSGATMWSLINEGSTHHARETVLGTIDALGGVQHVGLAFGEVDVRFHRGHYLHEDGSVRTHALLELLSHYKRFIDEELIGSGRVSGRVFVYHGYAYTSRTPEVQGHDTETCHRLHETMVDLLRDVMPLNDERVSTILRYPHDVVDLVSGDGVHLEPFRVYNEIVLPEMVRALNGPSLSENCD